MKRHKLFEFWNMTSFGILALFVVFLVFPIAGLLKEAVVTSDGRFSLDAFARFFGKSYYYSTIFNSFKIAFFSMALCLLLGIPFAYFYSFYKMKGRKLLFILCLLCTMSAPFIGAYAWILLLGNNGLLTNLLKTIGINNVSIYGFGGIVLVQTMKLFPLVVIYMNGAFRDVDNSLMEAAESMGCKGVNRFFKILITLTMPTILAAALLVFMRSFADFGTPLLIGRGYTTFPVLIYNEYLGENGADYHFASAISIIAVIVTGFFFLLQKIATSKFKFTISAMHPIEQKECHHASGILMHIYCYALVAISMLPQLYIIYMSFRKYNNSILLNGYSLVNYQKAFSKNLLRATNNTLIISIFTLAIIVVLAVLIAYLVVRKGNAISNLIDTISMLPYIMPGAVIGIALVIVYSHKPFCIAGTLVIMVIALAIRRLPFTSRSATAAMMKISPSIEEAALSLGASKLKSFVKITVPMMSSGIISGAVLSWVSIITEMSSGVILYNNRTITLTIGTYVAINNGIYGVAAAFATVTTILTIICLMVYLKFTKIENVRM
nr:iron ABC transporter permease [Sphaerochaeta pleomorpha]